MKRVVITGMGAVSPLGSDVKKTWQALISSKSGISKVKDFNTDDMPCKIAGLVHETENDTGFNYEKYLSSKEARRNDKFIIYGIGASVQAIEDSGWKPNNQTDLEKTGILIGSGIGGLATIEQNSILIHEQGAKKLSPFFIPSSLVNLLPGLVAMKYGFRGPNISVVTACATGTHAIGEAARIIQNGEANVMVAGGSEAAVCRIGMAGFAAAKTLSTHFNDTPEKASRPWDKDRDGFVMGNGAGILVLEEYEHAKKRGAKIYAELVGYGATGDAHHITAPHPDGLGAFKSMEIALKKAKLNPENIDYINAHGTSTPIGDVIELNTVQRVFKNCLNKICMSSTKSSIGHLLGAAGAIEAIFSILSINHGILPPTLNLTDPIDEVAIDLIPNIAKEKATRITMNNSFGFGGTNASLIFKSMT
ncbi:MAG: beta-ketoacyl-ACP synthase II [Rickettsiales bacterium]|nr:beta-ketoacyl-ACP synthase II [Rickettsiales bacterium]